MTIRKQRQKLCAFNFNFLQFANVPHKRLMFQDYLRHLRHDYKLLQSAKRASKFSRVAIHVGSA